MGMKLSELQLSALTEVGNVGSGHAAIALSQLMGKRIMIAIPSVEVVKVDEMAEVLGDDKEKYIHICFGVYGGLDGNIIFTMTRGMAIGLCDIMMGQSSGNTRPLETTEISALKEVGNIVSASYLNSVSSMTGMSLLISVPDYNTGGYNQIKDLIISERGESSSSDDVVCVKTEFTQLELKIDGYLLFMPKKIGVDGFIKALGV
jgi:chemotaxis protein CheC